MSDYQDALTGGLTPPDVQGFSSVSISPETQGYWPFEYTGEGVIISQIMEVTCPVPSTLVLPAANKVSEGRSFLIRNVSGETLTVKDNSGVVLGTVVSGIGQFFYVKDNSTEGGIWGMLSYGSGVSYVSAGQLQGLGTKAFGSTLGVSSTVVSQPNSTTLDTNHRGQLIEFTGGALTLSLQDTSVYGNDFYVFVKNAGSGTLTLSPASGEYVDGQVTLGMQPNESLILISDGVGSWFTVGHGRSVIHQFSQLILDVSAGGTFNLTSSQSSNKLLTFVGNPSTAVYVVLPGIVSVYYAASNLSTPQTIEIKTSGGTGTQLNQSQRAVFLCDGTNVTSAQTAAPTGVQSLVDGTSAAPALNFATKTNTGFYKYSTQGIGVSVNGVSQLYSNGGGAILPLGGQINGQLGLGGANYGTSGQFLKSNGPGAAPTWGTMAEITSVPYAETSGTAVNITGVAAVSNGGTGLSSYTAGDIIYASGTTTFSKLVKAAAGSVLLSGDAPSWGKVALTTHVSGTLPVANGGTGATSLSGLVQTTGDQTIGGSKTFNGATVKLQGTYTSGTYNTWLYIGSRHLRNVVATNAWEFVNAANTAVIASISDTGNITATTFTGNLVGNATSASNGGVTSVNGQTGAVTVSGVPTGAIVYFPTGTAPTGFLKANGAAISRTTYAGLFSVIGTVFGAGDGSTTFNLPDLRGEFLRGLDDGRGVDSGRALGGAQSWAIQNITGRANSDLVRFNLGDTDGAFAAESKVSRARPSSTTTGDTYGINFDASRVVQTANETRPRNVALLACIKY